MHHDSREPLRSELTPVPDEVTIRIRGLYKHYGKIAAVRSMDLDVRHGELFGLIGPDGAGKTTAFNILSGF
jgi:ABC-2 type transport system ATP-binding protein